MEQKAGRKLWPDSQDLRENGENALWGPEKQSERRRGRTRGAGEAAGSGAETGSGGPDRPELDGGREAGEGRFVGANRDWLHPC